MLCSTPYYREQPVGEWFVFVAMTAFWITLVTLFMYLLHAMEKFHVIPWLMIEFGFCALWTFFYFSAALAAAVEVNFFNSVINSVSGSLFIDSSTYASDSYLYIYKILLLLLNGRIG